VARSLLNQMRPTNWSEYLEASFTADTDSRRIAESALKMRSGTISHWIRMLQIFGGRRRSAASQQYQIKAPLYLNASCRSVRFD